MINRGMVLVGRLMLLCAAIVFALGFAFSIGCGCATKPPVIPPDHDVVVVTPDQPDTHNLPPVVTSERSRVLHVWVESQDGTRCDQFLKAVGWPAERVWVHTWYPAQRWSSLGRRVLSIKNPNGRSGSNPWDVQPKDPQAELNRMAAAGKGSGCVALSCDPESYIIALGPDFIKRFYDTAHASGLQAWQAPAIGYNHLLTSRESDDWAWTVQGRGRAGMTPEQVGSWLQQYTDGALAWSYGTGAQGQIDSRNYLATIGLTRHYVPMIDGLGRNKDADMAALAKTLWAEFGQIGVFVPDSRVGPQLTAAIRDLKDAP